MSLQVGDMLLHYRLLDTLGAGGMGEVFRAKDTKLGREVAIKVMAAEVAQDPQRRARFQREARAVAALQHPNIVTIFSVEEHEGLPFLIMELIDGRALHELIPSEGLSFRDFLGIAIPLSEAVSAAHEKGITHRDLKPANVMIDRSGRVKVLDFGLAKLLDVPSDEDDRTALVDTGPELTQDGRVLGTAAYMSPEQAEGRPVDARSDIFSLGVLFHEMLTGKRPFRGESTIATITSILRDTPMRVTEIRTALPRHLARIVERCLQKAPQKRYQTARDVWNELEALEQETSGGTHVSVEDEPAVSEVDGAPSAPSGARASFEFATRPSLDPGSARAPAGSLRKTLVAGGVVVVLALLALSAWILRDRSPSPAETASVSTSRPPPEPPAPPDPVASARVGERKMIAVLPFENLGPPEDAYFAAGMTEEIISRLASVRDLGVISRTSVVQYDRTGKTLKEVGADLGVGYILEGTVRWAHDSDMHGRVRITPQLVRVSDDTHLWANTYDDQIADIFEVQTKIATQVIEELGVALLGDERENLDERPTGNIEAYQEYLKALEPDRSLSIGEEDQRITTHLERATELDPEFLAAWATLSMHHSFQYFQFVDHTESRLQRAREALDRARALDPGHSKTLLATGDYYYYGFQNYDRALESYQELLLRSPNSADANKCVAFIYRRKGEWGAALQGLERARRLNPRDELTLMNLAGFYRGLRRYDQALATYDAYLELEPNNAEAHLDRALTVFDATGDLERATRMWESRPTSGQISDAFGSFEFAYLNRDWDGMREAIRSVELDLPFFPLLRKGLFALIDAAEYGPDDARPSIEAAVAGLEPLLEQGAHPHHIAHENLSSLYALLGRSEDAIRLAQSIVDRTSRDRYSGPQHEEHLAAIYTMVGQPERALDLIERLLVTTYAEPLTIPRLEAGLVFESLRSHPRYQALVQSAS